MIIESEKIRGGKPVIEGSRITVEDVAKRFFDLERGEKQIADDLGITVEQVEEALRYHHTKHKKALPA